MMKRVLLTCFLRPRLGGSLVRCYARTGHDDVAGGSRPARAKEAMGGIASLGDASASCVFTNRRAWVA